MLETVRCPGCSTRFVLSPARVGPGIRRAKCFRCDGIFGIEEAVNRLLGPAPAAPSDPPVLQVPDEPAEPLAFQAPDPPSEPLVLHVPDDLPEPEVLLATVPDNTPPFTLDDLGDLGELDEALDPPMVIHHGEVLPPALPVVHAPMEVPEPDQPGPPAGDHYVSAKDAIEKLMGKVPESAPVHPGAGTAMDVEATLDALASTLGGPIAKEAPAAPAKADMSSTVKLSSEEIKIAMASMGDHGLPPAPAAPAPVDFPPQVDSLLDPAHSPDLLKVQLEGETCGNLSIEQITLWIEEGRVRPSHMVARQHSEHWIEASKVPSLRPIFERVRKARGPLAAEMPAVAPDPPVKRGLFSGLFGRN